MPKTYQQDIRLMKFPSYYYYTFKDILDHLYHPDYVTEYYSYPIDSDSPVALSSDRYLPVPIIMAILESRDPVKYQNQLISLNSFNTLKDKKILPEDFDRTVRLRYGNMIYQKMHDSLLHIPDIYHASIPTISQETTWRNIVDTVNLAYLNKNGILKTCVKSYIKHNFH